MVSLLLLGVGSVSLPSTVTLLAWLAVVEALTVTTMVRWRLLPTIKPPMVQVTVPPVLAQPAEAEAKITPAGKVSVRTTPVALDGPG